MPDISRFYGILIYMNYNDHPPAHYHAKYQDQEVSIEIETGIVQGKMSKRALRLLFEWSELHREELSENWKRSRAHKEILAIEPLS